MKGKVLVIEDHDSLRQLIGGFLSKNFEVASSKNGLEALGRLSAGFLPDVIVTDARMPEIDGAEFLNNIRWSGLYSEIPVIVISGIEDQQEKDHFLAQGVKHYMQKPFNPEKLKDLLLQLIDNSNSNS